jgi:hypothetical protein
MRNKISIATNVAARWKLGPFGWGGKVDGTIASESWRPVVRAFEENFAQNLELGAQLLITDQDEVELCLR